MSDESDGMVDRLIFGEGTVPSIVTNAEDGTTSEALEPPIGAPKTPLDGGDCVRVESLASLDLLDERVDLLGQLK